MNNLQSLNALIEQTIQEIDEEVIEISSIDALYEISGMSFGDVSGGGQRGVPFGTKDEIEKDNENEKQRSHLQKEEGLKMISRSDLVTEKLMRRYIRKKIKENISISKNNVLAEERTLRKLIRKMIKEGDVSDIHPHRSTGINTLEDVLKKSIPTLRMDFKRLTTDKKQRDSFRAHIIRAVQDSLKPMEANDQYLQGSEGTPSSLLDEPIGQDEPEIPELEEANIDIDIEDEDKKIPVEDDDMPSPEEEFGTGLEDMDETGRNMAFTSFKKVSQYVLDAYDSLANPKDKEVFTEYLVTNLKLYFDKFEDELQNTVEEPNTPSYQQS